MRKGNTRRFLGFVFAIGCRLAEVVNCRSQVAVAGCRLQVAGAGCRLQVAGCMLQVAGAGCRLQVAIIFFLTNRTCMIFIWYVSTLDFFKKIRIVSFVKKP